MQDAAVTTDDAGPCSTIERGCDCAEQDKTAVGCSFFALPPGFAMPGGSTNLRSGKCYAVLMANAWTVPLTIRVEYDHKALDTSRFARTFAGTAAAPVYEPLPNGQLEPGKLAILFLNRDMRESDALGCPPGILPATTNPIAVEGTGFAPAFHIQTSQPAVLYDIYPYGGALSYLTTASLLLPVSSWGNQYLAIEPGKVPQLVRTPPYLQILASEDDTTIEIRPPKTISVVEPWKPGEAYFSKLKRGQFLQIMQSADLSGSEVLADHPIGLWGGVGAMNLPGDLTNCCADAARQQLPPIQALGSEYIAVQHANRDPANPGEERVPWRVLGASAGTMLSYDPPIEGAPATLAKGELVEFWTNREFVVRSQDDVHPFYVSGHMTSARIPETKGTPIWDKAAGDPEFVNVIAPPQYGTSYVFLTDPTYSDTNLVFTRIKTDHSFEDVWLDCIGTLSGWKPIGQSPYEYARVDLVREGQPRGQCTNGVHTAKSAAPFGITVWGWDMSVSYAYPAGMNVHAINPLVVR